MEEKVTKLFEEKPELSAFEMELLTDAEDIQMHFLKTSLKIIGESLDEANVKVVFNGIPIDVQTNLGTIRASSNQLHLLLSSIFIVYL